MKFVILSRKQIPGYSVYGPILTPAEYDIHLVLKWVAAGVDVREVMEDGSYRKLSFNDERLMEELGKKLGKRMEEREKNKIKDNGEIKPSGNVRLKPEAKKAYKSKVIKSKPNVVDEKVEVKEKEFEVKEEPVQFFIDELEKPE